MTGSRPADADARFERVMATHGPALARLVAVYERDHDARDDLLQDIAFALWKALPAFRGACSERTFVYRIAHNRALTQRARRRAHLSLGDAPEPADPAPGPAAALVERDDAQRLRSAVARLPSVLREAVVLRLEGLANDEVGEVLGITANNVAVRLNRARALLRDMLQPTGDTP